MMKVQNKNNFTNIELDLQRFNSDLILRSQFILLILLIDGPSIELTAYYPQLGGCLF